MADTNKAVLGDVILQPGRVDGGRRETDRVATLFSFVPIAFDTGSRNLVDCAFATLLGGIDYCPHTIHDHASGMSWPLKSGAEDLLVRDKVRKVGRTTGHSDGAVVAIEVNNLTVAMILGNGERLARFDRQIAIESEGRAFSASGDSGSLIISQDNAPAALLFAGTETGGSRGKGVTFANPIQTVFDALSIDLHLGS